MLSPDYYLRSVSDIDLEALRARGVDTLLVDLDNTLLPRDTSAVPESARDWAATLSARGFKVCLVSNNWHERVSEVADELGFDLVAKAVKPLPFAFLRALRKVGSKRSQSAVVGDQMFTDVVGGKLLGMVTVMVLPLSESDLPHTLALRRIERILLAGRQPLP
jgi:HAD superfamily phosphatase (TIGR01668 family)